MKKTLIIGASPNRYRYAHKAAIMLQNMGIEVVPLGIKKGVIGAVPIVCEKLHVKEVHTVAMYLNPSKQKEYYDYVIKLKPQRLIFNPGTENPELLKLAIRSGIDAINSCVLIMINSGRY
ncbi:MAG: CoA-binding protein [Bacteroidales bacterium]|nr:CoA-binding protein [Bacteroidales bacterium]